MNWHELDEEVERKEIERNDFIEVTLHTGETRRGVYGNQQGGTVGLYDYRKEDWKYYNCEEVKGLEKTTMVLKDLGDYEDPDKVPQHFLNMHFNQHDLPPFLSHRRV